MKANVTIETHNGPAGEYLLVNVTSNNGVIGVCDTTITSGTTRKSFFVGGECLVNVLSRENDDSSNRQIWQTSSIDKCKNITGTKIQNACEGFFKDSVPLSKAIQPVLEMLTNGLYVVHVSTVYPTDGAGNFFWNAYAVKHELAGSAPFNPVVGEDKCFSPTYLVPTKSFSAYSDKNVNTIISRINKGRKVGGIAYHLTGMFSALLYGHTNASACLACNEEFRCIIIEPLNRVVYGSSDTIEAGRINAVSCPYAKVRFSELSRKMTENFLMNRKCAMPGGLDEIKWKADKMLSNGAFAKRIMNTIEANLESLPDSEMLMSAYAIDELTDEQIETLLAGQTELNGRVIISPNYYESIVYACNYLQLMDKKRFIEFAKAILKTPTLSAAYIYVAGRLKYIMDSRVNQLFKEISASDEPEYRQIKEVAQKYAEAYSIFTEGSVRKFINNENILADDDDKPVVSVSTDDSNLSSLALANAMGR